jgi:hypothetical protein
MNRTEFGDATLLALVAKYVQKELILQWGYNYSVAICLDLENNLCWLFWIWAVVYLIVDLFCHEMI